MGVDIAGEDGLASLFVKFAYTSCAIAANCLKEKRLKYIFSLCLQMKRSILGFIAALVIGLLSMGLLGGGLYYAVYPVLRPFYGDPNDWHGDWVWPSLISAGMLWSLSFLAAGLLNVRLEKSAWRTRSRQAVYLAMLWLGAGLIWLIILSSAAFQS
jgi:hypothetical protein